MTGLVEDLDRRLAEEAGHGHTPTLGGGAELEAGVAGLRAVASTQAALFEVDTNSALLRAVEVGARRGILAAISLGNQKDAGSAVAAGSVSAVFSGSFSQPLVSRADVVPRLRRAMLESHDAIARVQSEGSARVDPRFLRTFFRTRSSLDGIGAAATAALALPDELFIAHVGDGCAVLVRDARVKQLVVPHTLSHSRGWKGSKAAADMPMEVADHVVLRVLGFEAECPEFDITRVELRPGDWVLLGNQALRRVNALPTLLDRGAGLGRARSRIAELLARDDPGLPPTVAILAVSAHGPEPAR